MAVQDVLNRGVPEDPGVLRDVDEAILLDCRMHRLDPTVLVVDPEQLQVRVVFLYERMEVLADVEVRSGVGVRADQDSALGVLGRHHWQRIY